MNNKIRTLDNFIISVCIFLTLSPVYVWGREGVIFGGTLLFFIFSARDSLKNISVVRVRASGLVFIFSLCFLKLNGASYSGALFFGVFLAVLTLLSNDRLVNIFWFLKIIVAVSVFPGLIIWLLHQAIGTDIFYLGEMPENLISNEFKKDAGQGYAVYPFTVVLDYMLEWPVYRMQGPFDEPGWLGTICALLIVAAGLDKKRAVDYIILLSGFLSFSLAFYIIIAIYSSLASRKSFLIFATGFSIFIFIASFFSFDVIDNYILQRLNVTESGISGYNRDGDLLNEKFSNFMNSSVGDIFLGSAEAIYDGSSSFKLLLVNSGLIGIFLMISIYLILICLHGKLLEKKFYIFLFLFLMSGLQRPDVVKPFMFFIFFAAPVVLRMTRIKTGKVQMDECR